MTEIQADVKSLITQIKALQDDLEKRQAKSAREEYEKSQPSHRADNRMKRCAVCDEVKPFDDYDCRRYDEPAPCYDCRQDARAETRRQIRQLENNQFEE